MFVDAIIFVLETGIPWADLPGRYGKHDTVYRRFDRWCALGVWERLLPAPGEADLEEVQLDSMTAKAHAAATTGHAIADAGYDSDAIRRRVRRLRARCCIRPNPTRKRKKRCDRRRYKHRNVVERFFCRPKRRRRVATRYEKKAENSAGFIYLAAFVTDNGGE